MLRPSTRPVTSSIRSASVDLPWSMWAMMQKFRMRAGSVVAGVVTVPPSSHAPGRWSSDGRGDRARVVATGAGWVSWPGWYLVRPVRGALRLAPWTHCQNPPPITRGSRVANIKSQIKRIKTNEIARQAQRRGQVRPEDVGPALPLGRRRPGTRRRRSPLSRSPARRSTRPPARASSTRTRRRTASRRWPRRSPALSRQRSANRRPAAPVPAPGRTVRTTPSQTPRLTRGEHQVPDQADPAPTRRRVSATSRCSPP